MPENLFADTRSFTSNTAWACVVYSMVPYLGILFVPFAFAASGLGFFASVREPELGGRNLALTCAGLSTGILLIQMFLWWLLYFVPKIGI
jgi:hypothetical protein